MPNDQVWNPGADQATAVVLTRDVDVNDQPRSHMEALTFYFPVVEGKDAVLRLHWGEVIVPLSIRVP